MRIALSFAAGLVFGAGILISGMANPAKVLNFFDLGGIAAGRWDPSLAFVMGGALLVTAIGYRLALRRPAPLAERRFHLPDKTALDARLIGGAALFGIGWGVTGFCPGGAVPALGLGRLEPLVFVATMFLGMIAARNFENRAASRPRAA
ncbi:DUF6691 family protein [Stappia sp.]|uniref:DUF6691 family protein n=1 Tax=Stappia sp. TaxID=1870903 RepID=UPI003D0BC5AE